MCSMVRRNEQVCVRTNSVLLSAFCGRRQRRFFRGTLVCHAFVWAASLLTARSSVVGWTPRARVPLISGERKH